MGITAKHRTCASLSITIKSIFTATLVVWRTTFSIMDWCTNAKLSIPAVARIRTWICSN